MATINKSITELVETLKDPLSFSNNEIEYAMRSFYKDIITCLPIISKMEFEIRVGNTFFSLYVGLYHHIFAQTTGVFYLSWDGAGEFIDKHFRFPLLPTEEERTLFEIEFGIQYPLKANRVAESYLNSNIQTN